MDTVERRYVAFLAESSRCLAESLDYESTLLTVATLALPFLGSWCIVDIVESDGAIRRIAIVHPDPEKQRLAAGLTKSWPPGRDDVLGAPQAVRTRQVQIIERVDDALLVAVARDEENLRILRALGIGSLIVVPLVARNNVLGALTLVSGEGGRPYTELDLQMAEDLGARCAIAIDNSRLHRDARTAGAVAAQMNERLVVASMREQELAEVASNANLAKSQFLSAMSHEIRTPLNAIIGFTALLDLEIAGPTTLTQRQYLARIKESSRHLLGLIEDILDLAKVEAGQMRVRSERVEAARSISEAVALVAPQATTGGVTIAHGCPDDCLIMADEDRVRQILLNLLSNAIKFTGSGGHVTVGCGVVDALDPAATPAGEGPWVFIRVADTGVGIPADRVASVFDPFIQVDHGLTKQVGGTGLGLTISRELARRMGGDLTLKSALGEGSCFTLWLPSANESPAS